MRRLSSRPCTRWHQASAVTDVVHENGAVVRVDYNNSVDGEKGTTTSVRTFDLAGLAIATTPGYDNATGLGVPSRADFLTHILSARDRGVPAISAGALRSPSSRRRSGSDEELRLLCRELLFRQRTLLPECGEPLDVAQDARHRVGCLVGRFAGLRRDLRLRVGCRRGRGPSGRQDMRRAGHDEHGQRERERRDDRHDAEGAQNEKSHVGLST
jgi:hypothetical protein